MALSDQLADVEKELKRLIEVVEGIRAQATAKERAEVGATGPAPRPTRIR